LRRCRVVRVVRLKDNKLWKMDCIVFLGNHALNLEGERQVGVVLQLQRC
jgi:hypothetical protein